MSNIHVNTEMMRHLGQLFVQLNEQIVNQLQPQIQHSIGQLEGDWQGISRHRFETLFQEWRSSIDRVAYSGEELGRHLQETAQRFENVDQSA